MFARFGLASAGVHEHLKPAHKVLFVCPQVASANAELGKEPEEPRGEEG